MTECVRLVKMNEELTEDQIAYLHQSLLTLQKELATLLVTSEESVQTVDLDQPIGRLSRMDAMQQQKMAQANRAAHQMKAKQVVAALAAFQGDEYGYCKMCDESIGFKRLNAKPEAPFCVNCQSRNEKR